MDQMKKNSKQSKLVTEELKQQIAPLFQKMRRTVVLYAILDFEDEKSLELGSFLKAIASVNEQVQVHFWGKDENEVIFQELHGEHLPVVGIYDESGVYSGACFHGVPGGKEINSFLASICNAGGAGQKLERKTKKEIEKIDFPVAMKIFVSLSCHHCPHVVAACQKVAMESAYVTADMYDAKLYSDLIEKYKIERVPMTVINDEIVVMGQKTIDEIVKSLTTM